MKETEILWYSNKILAEVNLGFKRYREEIYNGILMVVYIHVQYDDERSTIYAALPLTDHSRVKVPSKLRLIGNLSRSFDSKPTAVGLL